MVEEVHCDSHSKVGKKLSGKGSSSGLSGECGSLKGMFLQAFFVVCNAMS